MAALMRRLQKHSGLEGLDQKRQWWVQNFPSYVSYNVLPGLPQIAEAAVHRPRY
jgi:hypothetical protein